MKEVEKIFNKIGYKYGYYDVFSDLCTIAVCCFALGRYEDDYFAAFNKYDKETQKLFPELLAQIVLAYEENAHQDCGDGGAWCDPLGRLFEMYSSKMGRQAMGQFFTPEHICDLMARLTNDAEAKGSVCDPSCGSGRNLIAHSKMHVNNRLNCFYVGADLDSLCCRMTVLNLVFNGMKGVVIHMDSLSMEVFGGYRVHLPETGMGIVKLTKEQAMSYVMTSKKDKTEDNVTGVTVTEVTEIKIPAKPTKEQFEQLSLFAESKPKKTVTFADCKNTEQLSLFDF